MSLAARASLLAAGWDGALYHGEVVEGDEKVCFFPCFRGGNLVSVRKVMFPMKMKFPDVVCRWRRCAGAAFLVPGGLAGVFGVVSAAEDSVQVRVESVSVTFPERVEDPSGRARISSGNLCVNLDVSFPKAGNYVGGVIRVSSVRDSKGNDLRSFMGGVSSFAGRTSDNNESHYTHSVWCDGLPRGAYVLVEGSLEVQKKSGEQELPELTVPAGGSASLKWEDRVLECRLRRDSKRAWVLEMEWEGPQELVEKVSFLTQEDDFVDPVSYTHQEFMDEERTWKSWSIEADDEELEALKVNVTVNVLSGKETVPFRFRIAFPEMEQQQSEKGE